MRKLGWSVPVATLFAIAGALTAQPTPTALQTCWRPAALAQCRSWVVTELGYETTFGMTTGAQVNSSYAIDDFPGRFALTLGYMRNRGPIHAVGATATIAKDKPDGFITNRLEMRYRTWQSASRGLDISAGLARKTVHTASYGSATALGITAAAGISTTYVGIDGRVDYLGTGGRSSRAISLGIHSGSRASPSVAIVGAASFIVVAGLSSFFSALNGS
jgi:hypothetical protein